MPHAILRSARAAGLAVLLVGLAATAPAGAQAPGDEFSDCDGCAEMVVIPAGTFQMGGDPFTASTQDRESPQHDVTVASFALGKYEVTQAQWAAVMGADPSKFKGPDLPVEQVSWNDAQAFIQKLNAKTGKTYRLPTEAEWEYALRAGTTTEYPFDPTFDQPIEFAWYVNDSADTTHPVGEKSPNAFGLYDMIGNVWEWVADCYHDSYDEAPADGSAAAEVAGCDRVGRGGSWTNNNRALRAPTRARYSADLRIGNLGFRLARSLP